MLGRFAYRRRWLVLAAVAVLAAVVVLAAAVAFLAGAAARRIGLRELVDEPDPAFAQDGDGTLDVPVERAGNRRNGAEVVQ